MSNRETNPSIFPSLASPAQALRWQAEVIAHERTASSLDQLGSMSLEDVRRMLHELCVHQIELEMQSVELRRAQVELDAARSRYFDLYELAPAGYCTVSEKGLILQANLTTATLLGVSRFALIHQPFSQFVASSDQYGYYQFLNRLLASRVPQSCEIRMLQSDGSPLWVKVSATAGQGEDGTGELRLALSDITVLQQAQAALRQTNVELTEAVAIAEKASQAKSDFLSSMSHELRTPLGAILGFAQLMQSQPPAMVQKRSLEQIVQSGGYLLDLINGVLDFAQIESGKLSVSPEPLSLADALQECQALMEPQARARDIQMVFSPPSYPCSVNADRVRLKQVLLNLVSNALKYNRAGGKIVVDCVAQPTGNVRVRIRDTGAGIASDRLDQLFQPFNRLGREAGVEEGVGIGLALSKRLVEMMGGTIGAESSAGQGSVFWVDLKAATVPGAALALGLEAKPPQKAPAIPQASSLLYIEDNPINMRLVEEIVTLQSNMRFLSAADGTQGIAMARASLPDVILLDINLPDLNGFRVLEILTNDPETAHIPVIALTANAMPADIQMAMQAGLFRYITKPINFDELLDAVGEAVEISKTHSSSDKAPHPLHAAPAAVLWNFPALPAA